MTRREKINDVVVRLRGLFQAATAADASLASPPVLFYEGVPGITYDQIRIGDIPVWCSKTGEDPTWDVCLAGYVCSTAMQLHTGDYLVHGEGCPFCGPTGNAEDRSSPDIDGHLVSWPLMCTECGKEWSNHYELLRVVPKC